MEKRGGEPPKLDNVDILLLFIITIVALATRLWIIQHPNGVVFDEVYFGNFTNYYILNQFYYDIHPPLGKITAFIFGNLSEYDGSINFNDCPSYPIPDYVQLRITPAIFSALCGPMTYLAIRFASFSHASAATAAFLVIFDTSLGTEGRHILSDGILHFFAILHVLILMYLMTIPHRTRKFVIWHIISGLSLGAACSCKNTAWGLMALDAFSYMVYFWPTFQVGVLDYMFDVAIYGGTLAIIQFIVYVAVFSIHLILLPMAGPGTGYLSETLKRQLIKNDQANSSLMAYRVTKPGLLHRTIWLTLDMHRGNMGIQEFHDSQSFPKHWPLLRSVAVFFWYHNNQEIRCLGNVFSYYFCFFGVIAACFGFKNPKYWKSLRFVVGWAVCYFPFYLIPRVLYQYHYCIPLIIGLMAFASAIDMFIPKKYREICAVVFIALGLFGFWLWSPFTYGTPQHDRDLSIWTKRWVDGDSDHQSRRRSYYASKDAANKANK